MKVNRGSKQKILLCPTTDGLLTSSDSILQQLELFPWQLQVRTVITLTLNHVASRKNTHIVCNPFRKTKEQLILNLKVMKQLLENFWKIFKD